MQIGNEGMMACDVEIGPDTVFLEPVTASCPQVDMKYTTWPKAADQVGPQDWAPCSPIFVLPLDSGGQGLGLRSTNFMVSPAFVYFVLVCITGELSYFL